ncbi:MAG TPA: EVE domain-containing protein [Polyangiaceae bacterium]|nr:EVE domain-containing protein [Polyangiaceae bacterium]
MPAYFLVKSEPDVYSFDDLARDKRTRWDGVRSFEARNNLRAMKVGDLLLYYHSNVGKQVVGVARVVREAYADPGAPDEDWSAVDIEPLKAFVAPVTLAAIKADSALAEMALLKRSRLSVVPVSAAQFKRVLTLGKTKL